MFALAISCAVRGIAGVPVTVEADVSDGLPTFVIGGLTDRAIQEARQRVRAAIRNSGFTFPNKRLTVNLAPAEIPKEGTGFDLAVALAVLRCGRRRLDLCDCAFVGELALDGAVRPVAGVLAMARSLRSHGRRRIVVPVENASEAALIDGLEVVGTPSLRSCVDHLERRRMLPPAGAAARVDDAEPGPDLDEIRGQKAAKRSLEIAAAGGHSLLLLGPPGSGKTMLARAAPSLLPDLDVAAALEVAAIHSLRGALRERAPTSPRPPFRAPHHSISRAGLIGGGAGLAQPGEISLAHRGLLFLDELCEFPRAHLEALRQPLEERRVTLARSRGSVTLPTDFALVAASNPCPCGHLGDPRRRCGCAARELELYRARLSGPVRDRLDMVVHVPRQGYGELFGAASAAGSAAAARSRVAAARERQLERGRALNASLGGDDLLGAARPTPEAVRVLADIGERSALSGRAYHRVLRVARTIADLDGDDRVGADAVKEALRYRDETPG